MTKRYKSVQGYNCGVVIDTRCPQFGNNQINLGGLKDTPGAVFHIFGTSLDAESNWCFGTDDELRLKNKTDSLNENWRKALLPY